MIHGSIHRARDDRRSERGHLLVGLVVLIAVMLILLTAAAQSWTFLIRRDREAELIQRGEEYARAIEFYKNEVGAYPLKLDLLSKKGPHGHRFIRKLYEDPLSDDGAWGLLLLSPTGQGFINPYATQISPDAFLGGNLEEASGFGSSGLGNKKKPGYSEMDPQTYKAFEGHNLPIVGVVHRKEEWGLKIYKGQATLNDWAFTMMEEGQGHSNAPGQSGQKPIPRGPVMGIGDLNNPIQLPGMRGPAPPRGMNEIQRMRAEQRKLDEERERKEEEERRAAEEAGQTDDSETGGEEGESQDGAGGEDEEGDESGQDDGEGEDDGGEDEDPNGEDPNGEDEDPNG